MRLATEELLPLHSIEAEMSTLGSMILKESAAEEVFGILKDEDFYLPAHRDIFRAMRQLVSGNKVIDLITLKTELVQRGLLGDVGGQDYLIQLAETVPSASNAAHYAGIVLEKSTLRRLNHAGHEIVKIATDGDMTPDDKIDKAEHLIFEVGNQRLGKDFLELRSLAREFMVDMDTLYETNQPILGVTTGFTDLNSMTSGLYGGDFIIVAARPSMGKTSLVLKMALEVAKARPKENVAIFSLEMSGKQLARRLGSMISGVSANVLKQHDLSEKTYQKLADACELMYELPIYIDESSDISGLEMRGKCRRLKREGGLSLVIVDYLQLMRGNRKTENRVQEISDIARSLKALSKELDVPVIALSQLNRGVESRENKRPQLSDIRESGSIEAEADLVMFIYRDEYYKARENPEEANNDPSRVEVAEIIIAKHRNGPVGTVKLAFKPQFALFENLAKSEY
ncbi:MAG TPA: replicative DNA helicase [Fimbriimonadaceae bacterium]|nr:replicative DNA helicase [Fimbriimonadaceae bacterium]